VEARVEAARVEAETVEATTAAEREVQWREAEWRRTSASTTRVVQPVWVAMTVITCGTSFPQQMLILLTEENREGAFSAAVSLFRLTVAAF
jgi:hypothetical protein